MHAEMPWRSAESSSEFEHLGGDRSAGLGGRGEPTPALDLPRPGVLLSGFGSECFGRVTHRRPRSVGDDVGDLRGVVSSVTLVDVLDDLLAAAGLDVDVDIGRSVAMRGEEPLEQQPE